MHPVHISLPVSIRSILTWSSYPRQSFPSGLFPSGFLTKILYAFFTLCYTSRPSHLLWFGGLIIFGEAVLCTFHSYNLSNVTFPSSWPSARGLTTRILHAFLVASISSTCPAHLSLLYFTSLTMPDDRPKTRRPWLNSVLNFPFTCICLDPYIFVSSTLLSSTCIMYVCMYVCMYVFIPRVVIGEKNSPTVAHVCRKRRLKWVLGA
jgi:hypothetical protein